MQPQPHPQPSQHSSDMTLPIILLGLVCLSIAFPAFLLSLVIWWCIRRSRRGQIAAVIVALLGAGLLFQLREPLGVAFSALQQAVSGLIGDPGAWAELRASIAVLWGLTLPAAPLLAVVLVVARPHPHGELESAQANAPGRKPMPEERNGAAVLGTALGGDLTVCQSGRYAVYPLDLLQRHAVFVGSSGSGKTEAFLRIAYLARKVYGWKVFFLDAKGDRDTAARFAAIMAQAGAQRTAMFPIEAYNGWRGDATGLFNRLMQVEDYSESYYKAVAKDLLGFVCSAPGGPPRSSVQFLERLWPDKLRELYAGQPELADIGDFDKKEPQGIRKRYRGFFNSLKRKLDGVWDFGSVDAGYLLLDGLALKEESVSLGRYLFEDFTHYVAFRKPPEEKVLLITDEFSALSRGADVSNLFERLRSYNAAIIVSSQSYEGLGLDAERMLSAAAGGIFVFQCANPERLTERAGTRRGVAMSYQIREGSAPSLTGPTTRQPAAATMHERDLPKIDPNQARQLPVGHCFLIARGAYERIRFERVQVDAEQVAIYRRLFSEAEHPPLVAPGLERETVELLPGDHQEVQAAEEREPEEEQSGQTPEPPELDEKDRHIDF